MTITGFTPLNTQHCILNEARIDLWQFSLEHELHIAYQLLNADEKARADRFYFSKHKKRFTIARATLRIILARYLNSAPEQLEFLYGSHGKPSVVNSQKLEFNLSHSGAWGLLAVGKVHPVGVDIEQFSARPYEGIAKSIFSESELKGLQKAPKFLKPALFFHIWAQKEAFIKASGLGLSYPTQEFHVPTSIPTKQLIDDPLHNMTWQMRSFMPQVAYSAAVCHHPKIREVRYGLIQLHDEQLSLSFE